MAMRKPWWQDKKFKFIRIPKVLIENSRYMMLSSDALLLYGLVLDRCGLSAKNKEFMNHAGVPFVIFTNAEIQRKLRCRHQKASKVLKELETAGLVIVNREHQGSRANKIFVMPFIENPAMEQDSGNT